MRHQHFILIGVVDGGHMIFQSLFLVHRAHVKIYSKKLFLKNCFKKIYRLDFQNILVQGVGQPALLFKPIKSACPVTTVNRQVSFEHDYLIK